MKTSFFLFLRQLFVLLKKNKIVPFTKMGRCLKTKLNMLNKATIIDRELTISCLVMELPLLLCLRAC